MALVEPPKDVVADYALFMLSALQVALHDESYLLHMKLNLERPIVFLDLETTGVRVTEARIVEIALLRVSVENEITNHCTRLNPTIPIPKEASAIHGITDEDIKDEPTFKEVAARLFKFLANCDLAGYNSNNFDVPLLAEEFLRAGFYFDLKGRHLVDVQTIFHKKEPRTLEAAYRFYCQKELEKAHSAEADIHATYEVFLSQLKKYTDLENNISFLHKFTERSRRVDHVGKIVYDDEKREVLNFGRYFGQPVAKVLDEDAEYIHYLIEQASIPLYSKKVLYNLRKELQEANKDNTSGYLF